ncbi:homoserine O-acetyltransferase MetX [Dictyobacter arantiisoli]|uniref:Homoserine O-acetyltransferase n=1 Tax=Dictyobacter arantiisoli TaxID=2014874 RepID=A0A5A5T6P6_9CHLR|nr:homoserine O-acetyltransferase [Dictyobacter arantiisoli]GCF06624.1 homoserine O-acetyltransferase [Dictyobacter arantiisoli]
MVAQLQYINHKIQVKPENEVLTFTFDQLLLQRGGRLGPVTLAYETWGELNATGDNAILITHALTGSSHAHDVEDPENPKVAWWNPLIGPGKYFDTSRFFVICSNIIGGCSGSTGPSSINPLTGRPYGMRFPVITIRDMVRAQRKLIEHLGVRRLAMVVGGSIGGQQALEWAVHYPHLVDKVIVMAASAAVSAQAIAFNEVARQSIMADPAWLCGDYLPGQGPTTGLSIARMLAMITYQSEESMEMRFARNSVQREVVTAPTFSPELGGRFDVENYLYYQGDRLAQRFDANSYLYVSRAMDLYDVSEDYLSLDEALRRIRSQILFVGIRSDFLFPASQVRWLAEKIQAVGGNAQYAELDSPHGHDAFLKEWSKIVDTLQEF